VFIVFPSDDALTPNLNKKIKKAHQVSKKLFFYSFVCVWKDTVTVFSRFRRWLKQSP